MKFIPLLLFFLFFSLSVVAKVDFKQAFQDRDACFVLYDLENGKTVSEYNPTRCKERFTPCSSFKIAAALMAFEKGILKDVHQTIKWDGVRHTRREENRDQTPLTWMSDSVKWVTEWIMPQLGPKSIQQLLKSFSYGNEDFSGGIKDAWVTSSLKISAYEQISFLTKIWKGDLPLSRNAIDRTKEIIFIKKLGNSDLYGKTGTGCLEGRACMNRPGKMIGTFVGVLKSGKSTYVFASNASDLKDQLQPAGPRLKSTTIEILKSLGLVSDENH